MAPPIKKKYLEVKQAFLHQASPVLHTEKHIGQLKHPGIKLIYAPEGLVYKFRDMIGIIPHANVASCELVDGSTFFEDAT